MDLAFTFQRLLRQEELLVYYFYTSPKPASLTIWKPCVGPQVVFDCVFACSLTTVHSAILWPHIVSLCLVLHIPCLLGWPVYDHWVWNLDLLFWLHALSIDWYYTVYKADIDQVLVTIFDPLSSLPRGLRTRWKGKDCTDKGIRRTGKTWHTYLT